MKKFFTTSLAVAMAAATLGTTAFAADAGSKTLNSTNGYSHTIDVYGTYTSYQESAEIISVDVEWEAMSFTYAEEQQGTWNPSTHEYDNDTEEAGWVDNSADITVTNHSNVDVTATFSFAAEDAYNDVSGTNYVTGEFKNVDENSYVELNAGVENKKDKADSKTVTFEIGGKLGSDVGEETQLGTITVSVAKK